MRFFSILGSGVAVVLAAAAALSLSMTPAATKPSAHPAMMKMTAAAPAPALAPAPGCAYHLIDVQKYGMQPFAAAPVIRSVNHVLTIELDVQYTDAATTTIAGCHVHLRTYGGKLIGPTLRVAPGDSMHITVVNKLPSGTTKCPMPENGPMGNDLDITNLHTHGLHVSPSGISDNVFIEICPQAPGQPYVIDIPKDQPPGTYWYHAHVHGSTAVQVSSGMEGAIIVEGGIDTVPEIAKAAEKTFLLQQISYDQQGVIESLGQFTPTSWPDSKRTITVNGQIAPVITMRPGEVQHWRFIHGGVRETIDLYATTGTTLNEVSTDGNALGRIDAWKQLELEPGYRSDVLFKAPLLPAGQSTMRYYLRSAPLKGTQRLQFRKIPGGTIAQLNAQLNAVQPGAVIAVIDVSGAPQDMAMPTNAELAPFVPFQPITPGELNGAPQTMAFSIENAICNGSSVACTPCDPNKKPANPACGIRFMVDDFQYPDSPTRQMKLNTASKWDLSVAESSLALTHPFHIHVNPFEMVRTGPDGKPETVWKDTLLVRQGQPTQVLSRYTDFTGAFVLHCHILDHEDQGMMQRVEIVP
ncbi:MAG TPA: multicopper oxidase family protein [Rhizomicrobium sp.]|jgi:FtsP/CotA-like multicopper oxidase with cupredoxin domain|nr:multicopper oxidase family protein [Rhizomicrobium sp.]